MASNDAIPQPTSALAINASLAAGPATPFETVELTLRPPNANELLVKVVAAGICHTDVMTKTKALCDFPIVLGHEGVGVVEAVGSGTSGFLVGDHVIMTYDYCGTCPQCVSGAPSYCDHHGELNFAGVRPDGLCTHRHPDSETADIAGSFFQQSSFATYALSHVTNTIKVDASLPLELLAPLGCGVQTGAGTVLNTLDAQPGTTMAVFGCGCVGLSAVMAATVAGVENIIAIDVNGARLAMAEELGATSTLNPEDFEGENALVEAISTVRPSGCHYAIDTTGNPEVLRQAFEACGPMGVTAMIAPGVPGTEVTIEMMGLLPGKSLRGVVQGDSVASEFIPYLIELWQDGKFPFDKLITTFDGLDSLDEAVNAMTAGEVIKPVVIVDPEGP